MSPEAWGLVIVRVPLGLLLFAHGAQKLLGWFGGDGLEATAHGMTSLGYRNGRAMAVIAGFSEIVAGAGIALGLLTLLAAAAAIGTMTNAAVAAHGKNGIWAQNGGYEYPLVVATVAAGLAVTGPGGVALDALWGWERHDSWWGAAAIAFGILGAFGALARRRRAAVNA